MATKLTFFLILLTFLACRQVSERQLKLAKEVIKSNGLINLSVNNGNYAADTLILTAFDSLDKKACPSLIFKKENRLDACLPAIFKNTGMGISQISSWNLSSETGILNLDITEIGIDNKTHYKAEYRIDKLKPDTVTLVRTKTIINE